MDDYEVSKQELDEMLRKARDLKVKLAAEGVPQANWWDAGDSVVKWAISEDGAR